MSDASWHVTHHAPVLLSNESPPEVLSSPEAVAEDAEGRLPGRQYPTRVKCASVLHLST